MFVWKCPKSIPTWWLETVAGHRLVEVFRCVLWNLVVDRPCMQSVRNIAWNEVVINRGRVSFIASLFVTYTIRSSHSVPLLVTQTFLGNSKLKGAPETNSICTPTLTFKKLVFCILILLTLLQTCASPASPSEHSYHDLHQQPSKTSKTF